MFAGISMNILHVYNKSPGQRGFLTNNVGDLLPALGFLGCIIIVILELYFLKFKSWWYVEVVTFYRFGNDQILPKTRGWNKSLQKLKTT